LRQNLLRLPADNAAAKAARSMDFFTTGTCRGLFFDAHHHRLALPDIAAFLKTNGLELLGVETTPHIRQAFAKRYPGADARTDLAAWHAFEREHPDLFVWWYQLWLRKPRVTLTP